MFEFIGIAFNIVLYQPIFNFLIWLYLISGNFGLAILILTVVVRTLLHPLNNKSLKSQKELQEIQPLIKELQEKYKTDNQKQAEELIKLYKEKGFNPFAGFWYMLLQIPIILALYQVINYIASNPDIQSKLYSFIHFEGTVNPMLFTMNLSEPNLYFAVVVGIAQFFQIKTMQPKIEKSVEKKEKDQTEKMQEMMQKQMLILFPIFTFFILTQLPSALGIYWLVVTIFSIVQQKIIFKN